MITTPRSSRGFTIVELLIVIVVIGILAAISIVAYNGIQGRAQAAAASSALDQTAKKLALYVVESGGAYPIDLATIGITNSSTSYQYSFNNSVTPQTYCVTATNGSTSYKVSSTATAPSSGGCAGHGVGGVEAVTNLVTYPSFEAGNMVGYGFNSPTVTGTQTVINDSSMSGSYVLRRTTTSTASASGVGPYIQVYNISPSESTYTLSAWIRTSKTLDYRLSAERRDSTGANIGTLGSSMVTVPANTWTRLTLQMPSLANIDRLTFCIYSGTNSWVAGDWVDYDGLMVTKGSNVPTYADGSSPNWMWNGAVNNSTSTGPPL